MTTNSGDKGTNTLNKFEFGKISDNELNRQFSGLRKLLRVSKFSNEKQRELEVQYCYLQREIEMRKKRVEAHEVYMKTRSRRRRNY